MALRASFFILNSAFCISLFIPKKGNNPRHSPYNRTVTRPLSPARLFALVALSIITICVLITRSQLAATNLDIAAWGVTFDLTLTIPLVYYFIVVRPGAAKPLTLIPLFVVCMMLAAFVVPRGQQQLLHDLRFISAPLELVTIVLVVRRLSNVRDVTAATRALFGDTRLASFVECELGILRYALFSWRDEPEERGFTVHQRSGWGSIVACFITLLVFESIGMHLLVLHWSTKAAWIVTALDIYGMLWLAGDYHALRLRPSFSRDGILHVRYGMRWSLDTPLANIASIDEPRGENDWKRKGVLKMAMLDAPTVMVRLHEPVIAAGLAGIRKTVDTIAILPDDLSALEAQLR